MLRKLLWLGMGVLLVGALIAALVDGPTATRRGQGEIRGQWDSMSAAEQAELCDAYTADPQRVLATFLSGVRANNPDASDWDVDAAQAEVEFFLNNNC